MRVAIDARPLSHPQVGGFRTYVRALVQGLAEVGGQDEFLLYLDRPLPSDAPSLPPNMAVRILDSNRLRSDFVLFRRQVRADRPDLVYGTMNYVPPGIAAPEVVAIHDALEVRRYPFVPIPKKPRARLMRAYSALLTRRSARRARRLITVSAASAREIRSALGLKKDNITVVYNGLVLSAPPAEQRSEDIVLALASTDPRKNFDLLLRALGTRRGRSDRLPRLHVVCTNDTSAAYVKAAAQRYGMENLCLLRSLSDAELAACYARATVFVWPSRLEGFGLPPLEAMAAGCPVVSSSAPAMPELLGDAPLWFDPDRPDQLADALGTMLGDADLRREMAERGRAHAAQFTCRRMGERTLAVWREAIA